MPKPIPHRLGIEQIALYHVLKTLEDPNIGFPSELNNKSNKIIEEARVTLIFELAWLAAHCIQESLDGFEEMTTWMKCHKSEQGTEEALAYAIAHRNFFSMVKSRSKYYNLIKYLLIEKTVILHRDEWHSTGFEYDADKWIWFENTNESKTLVKNLDKIRDEFTMHLYNHTKAFEKAENHAKAITDHPELEKFRG